MREVNLLFDVRLMLVILFLVTQKIAKGNSITYEVSSNKKKYDEAKTSCEDNGGSLAILDTVAKRKKLNGQIDDASNYWIGLKGPNAGELKWVDKTSATNVNCPVRKNQQCCTFKHNNGVGEFIASPCRSQKNFVCQKNSVPPSTAKPTTTSRQKGIDKIRKFRIFVESLDESDPESMEKLLDEFDELIDELDPESFTEDDFNPLLEVQIIESFAMEYTKSHLNSNKTILEMENEDIAFHAEVIQRSTNSSVIISSDKQVNKGNFITIPEKLFQDKEEVFVVTVVFKIDKNDTLRKWTPKIFEGTHSAARVNTRIISLNTHPKLKEPFDDNILINFGHIEANVTKDPSKVYCSYWNYSMPTSHNGSWSGRGCRVKSTTFKHTVCECNHMTNFAVLMQLKPEKKIGRKHEIALTTITYVGLVLSLIGEAVTIFCYCVFLNVQNDKIQIRLNLLCTLAGAQLVMMAGISQTGIKGVCVFVAAVIHYLYLVAFCWMLMEAVFLYRLVVKVFDIIQKRRISYIFSYGCPAAVVLMAVFIAEICTGGVHTYCNPNFCWVNFENKLIWSFVAPVLLIVVTNSILLFCVIKEMFSMKTLKTISSVELSMIRASVRACVVLLPLLGITWVFGLLSLADIGITWQYIFTILNATQGFLIFIFHCLRNTELKTAISLRVNQWQSNHSNNFSKGRVSPDKYLNRETKSAKESPRSSIPMATGITNRVIPNNTI